MEVPNVEVKNGTQPFAFALGSFLIIASAFVTSPREPIIGTGIVLFGVPVYYLWRRVDSARH